MIYSVQQIKYELLAYIKEYGGAFGAWYVGIAADPMAAMLRDHQVDQDRGIWIYKQALSFHACRTVQSYCIEKLRTDGRPVVDGDSNMDCVYMFRKGPGTIPSP